MTKERPKTNKRSNPSSFSPQKPMSSTATVPASGKPSMQHTSDANKNLTPLSPVAGPTDQDHFMEKFGEMVPENLHDVHLESCEFIFGDIKGDQQVYLIDKVTSKLKLFYIDGEVSDATLFSDQLSAKRIHGTRVDRYRLAIDMEPDDLSKAHEVFNLLGDLANTPSIMRILSAQYKVKEEEIDVLVHGPQIRDFQVYNNAASPYRPKNPLSKFLIPTKTSDIMKPNSFYVTPSPLVIDENRNQLHDISAIDGTSVRVFINVVGSFYLKKLHVKPRMIIVQRAVSRDAAIPLAKKLKTEILMYLNCHF